LDEVKEVVRGFLEEMFEAVSYMVATVIILAALELKERLSGVRVGQRMEVLLIR